MQIIFGAPVYSRDQLLVGVLDRVVIDPTTTQVLTVAIRQGHLLTHSIEVSIASLHQAPDGLLTLTVPLTRVSAFRTFNEDRYRPSVLPAPDLAEPESVGLLLPTDYPIDLVTEQSGSSRRQTVAHEIEAMLSSGDLTHAVLGPGSAVHSTDGVTVGTVQEVITADVSARLVACVARSRAAWPSLVTLSASTIAGVDDDLIIIRHSAAWFMLWASLEPGLEVWTSDRIRLGMIEARQVDYLVVIDADGHRWAIPSGEIDRLDQNRLLLHADHAKTTLWTLPASGYTMSTPDASSDLSHH